MRGDADRSIWIDRTGAFAANDGTAVPGVLSTIHHPPFQRPNPPQPNPTHTEPSLGSQATALAAPPKPAGRSRYEIEPSGARRAIPCSQDAIQSVPSSQNESDETASIQRGSTASKSIGSAGF